MLDGIGKNFSRLRAFDATNPPPWGEGISYNSAPFVVQKAVALCKKGNIINPGGAGGQDIYFPLLKDEQDVWISNDALEFFPTLPMKIRVNLLALPWLNIRRWASAASPKADKPFYWPGTEVTIYEYFPSASDVWARTDDGWIALSYRWREFTSWYMQTQPPVPPKAG